MSGRTIGTILPGAHSGAAQTPNPGLAPSRAAAGMSDFGDGARASFEPRHGRDPRGRHLVIKPGRKRSADGSRAGPSDLSTVRQDRNVYKHCAIRRYRRVYREQRSRQRLGADRPRAGLSEGQPTILGVRASTSLRVVYPVSPAGGSTPRRRPSADSWAAMSSSRAIVPPAAAALWSSTSPGR